MSLKYLNKKILYFQSFHTNCIIFFITYSNKSNASINLNTTDNSIIENGKQDLC
ncbi:hypothetical protein CM15mP35_10390 [bacterium]|nr:MAG: hypothetical protein CM15mP35_10390 [bacterium]